MPVPPAFNKLCSYIHQDIDLDLPSFEEWIQFAGGHLDHDEKAIAKRFAGELLDGTRDTAELQRIWFASGADIYFPAEEGLRQFLGLIRDTLN